MSKRAYAIASVVALSGAIVTANVALVVSLSESKLGFAGMVVTGLLGLAGTLAGRGNESGEPTPEA